MSSSGKVDILAGRETSPDDKLLPRRLRFAISLVSPRRERITECRQKVPGSRSLNSFARD